MKHNWQYKKFDEIADSITPRTKIDKSDYLQKGIIPIISQEETFISGYWNNTNDITPHNGPVVIFGDHSRVLKYIDFDFVVGADGVKIIMPKNGTLAKFLYHFLKWYNIPSLGYSRHFKLVKEALFPLPPLEEQQRIVAELDRINAVMEDCRQLLRTLDALAQSLFYDSFGDPISNPKAWPTHPLKEVAPASSSKVEPEESNGKFWLLNLDQVESNTGRIIEKQFFSIEEIGASTVLFDENNVLYSKLRPYLNKVVIPNGRGYCTSELIPLKPNNLLKEYLAYSLRLPEFVQYISGKTGGAKMPRVKMNYFWDFKLPVPPLELQQQFARRIEAIEARKKAVEKTISTLQTLLDSRMDYWFN